MNLFKSIKTAAIAAVVGIGMAGAAIAMPVSGTIQIAGAADSIIGTPGSLSAINFSDSAAPGAGTVANATGNLTGLIGDAAAVYNMSFPLATPFKVWELSPSGLSFTITSVLQTSYEETTLLGQQIIDATVVALGFFSGGGFDNTGGAVILTANQGATEASFSASHVVPLPASVLLLGSGMLGLGAIARRRKKQAEAA